MGLKIVTDSSCDLGMDYIKENEVGLLNLILNINGKTIKDDFGQTLSYEEFYSEMRNGAMPTTSQANVNAFEKEFLNHVKNGDSIIYIGMSSNLSGTYNSANIAKNNILEEYPNADISLVDSLSVSVGLGIQVAKACEMKKKGFSKDEIVEWLEENKYKVGHSIIVDDLNHLKRGGRISGATAIVGGILNIKPTLTIDNEGRLINVDKVKGKKKAIKHIANEIIEKAVNTENEILYICHGDCLEEAETLKELVLEETKFKDVIIRYLGVCVAAHGGPGALAAVFLSESR